MQLAWGCGEGVGVGGLSEKGNSRAKASYIDTNTYSLKHMPAHDAHFITIIQYNGSYWKLEHTSDGIE